MLEVELAFLVPGLCHQNIRHVNLQDSLLVVTQSRNSDLYFQLFLFFPLVFLVFDFKSLK